MDIEIISTLSVFRRVHQEFVYLTLSFLCTKKKKLTKITLKNSNKLWRERNILRL